MSDTKFGGAGVTVRCSFCLKEPSDVAKLIAGPGVYICDECVVLCVNILDEEGIVVKRGTRLLASPTSVDPPRG